MFLNIHFFQKLYEILCSTQSLIYCTPPLEYNKKDFYVVHLPFFLTNGKQMK